MKYWYYRAKAKKGFTLLPHQLFPEPTCVPANNHKAFYSKIPETHRWIVERYTTDIVKYAGREYRTTTPWKYFIVLPFNLPTFKQLNSHSINLHPDIMRFIYESSRVDPYALEYKKEADPKKQPRTACYIDNTTKMQRELDDSSKLADDETRLWIYNFTTTPLTYDTMYTNPNRHRITLLEVSPYLRNHLGTTPIPVPSNIPDIFREADTFNTLVSILKPSERFKYSRYNAWNNNH